MGSQLIGYLLIGPSRVEDTKKEDAINYIQRVVNTVRSIRDTIEEQREFTEAQIKYIDSASIYLDKEDPETILEEFCSPILDLDEEGEIEAWVNNFVDFWHSPEARDVGYRFWNDKTILFAGDCTYGDTPTGYGYKMLSTAYLLDVLEVFGIQ